MTAVKNKSRTAWPQGATGTGTCKDAQTAQDGVFRSEVAVDVKG